MKIKNPRDKAERRGGVSIGPGETVDVSAPDAIAQLLHRGCVEVTADSTPAPVIGETDSTVKPFTRKTRRGRSGKM